MEISDRRSRELIAVMLFILGSGMTLLGQEPSATPLETPSTAASLAPMVSPTPVPVFSPSATPAPVRNVRISFLPPPLEGTISLGIYNEWDQLVRVLHQEADLDEFTVGEDALSTKWDGRDDYGQAVAPGKYQARGFVVANLKTERINSSPPGSIDFNANASVPVKLMANPLANDERPTIQLGVGFDDENSFLKTADGLPVYTIANKPNVRRATMAKAGDKAIDIWEDDGARIEQIRISNVDKMMAFDCGDFEVK
jgi:hypothetical protein